MWHMRSSSCCSKPSHFFVGIVPLFIRQCALAVAAEMVFFFYLISCSNLNFPLSMDSEFLWVQKHVNYNVLSTHEFPWNSWPVQTCDFFQIHSACIYSMCWWFICRRQEHPSCAAILQPHHSGRTLFWHSVLSLQSQSARSLLAFSALMTFCRCQIGIGVKIAAA